MNHSLIKMDKEVVIEKYYGGCSPVESKRDARLTGAKDGKVFLSFSVDA